MYIPINTSQRLGAAARTLVDNLKGDYAMASNLINTANQMVNGSDYSQVESFFGLTSNGQTGTSSTGYSFLSQLQSTFNLLDQSAAFKQFLAQCG